MKRVCILLIFVSFVQLGHSQDLTAKINTIRLAVEQINKESLYKVRALNNQEFLKETPDGGGELKAYYKNGTLVKLIERIYLSRCVRVTEYYFRANKLIFAYTEEKGLPGDKTSKISDDKTLALKMECRFYFENSKVIKSILKGETICSGKPDQSWGSMYVENVSHYKKVLSGGK